MINYYTGSTQLTKHIYREVDVIPMTGTLRFTRPTIRVLLNYL